MKQLPLIYLIAILSALSGILALSLGDLKAEVSNNDFNIVLITIDALRPDHLSCYGYNRNTTPNIDKIAEGGIIFSNAISPSSWTLPSMVSLFTSTYPINHGVTSGRAKKRKVYNHQVFSDRLTTLAEILQANGYTTFGVASNIFLSENLGFGRGFDYFKCIPSRPAPYVNETIYSWEGKIKKSEKFFIWMHYIDPHFPYQPRKPWIDTYITDTEEIVDISEKSPFDLMALHAMLTEDNQEQSKHKATLLKKNLLSLYDSEINYVDSYVGELIRKFKLDKNTLLIITADHGEGFFEHGILGHTFSLYQETIRIPLIVKLPYSTKKGTINNQVNLIDIMPSILQTLNINPPEHIAGKSFWEKKGLLFWIKKVFFKKNKLDYTFSEKGSNARTVMTPEWKYIYNYGTEKEQLYNIKSDPLELDNLVDKNTKQRNQLKKQLFHWVSNATKYPVKEQHRGFTQEEKEKLEVLGYITTRRKADYDGAGILDDEDNCPNISNPDQEDTYPPGGNGCGDACDCIGNLDRNGEVGIRDVSLFKNTFGRKNCTQRNPCNGDLDCDGDVDDDDYLILKENVGRRNCAACEFICNYE